MPLSQIAIIGRPNVGKSTLFNRICGKRMSIVYDQDGVTRDRIYSHAQILGKTFSVVDTGGFFVDEYEGIYSHVMTQVKTALDQSDVIIMVVDGKHGLNPADVDIANMIKTTGKKIVLAVNKLESVKLKQEVHQFHNLGIEDIFGISAEHGDGVFELLEHCISFLVEEPEEENQPQSFKLCIAGKPNVGKSTFMNSLMGFCRSLVDDKPGTTTDCIHSHIDYEGQKIKVIDTAGIEKSKNVNDFLTKICMIKTQKAICESNIVLVILDSTSGPKALDKRIISTVENENKGCIIFLNKWDMVNNIRMEHTKNALQNEIKFKCPVVIGSALTGRNVLEAIQECIKLNEKYNSRMTTGELNRLIGSIIKKFPPPIVKGRRLKIYYVTQASTGPPSFVFFVNNKKLLDKNWAIFMKNSINKNLELEGVPVRLFFRSKKELNS